MNEQQENRYSRLTVEQKKYLENGILNNVKNKDIAKILGISVNRVSSYKSRNAATIGLQKAPVTQYTQVFGLETDEAESKFDEKENDSTKESSSASFCRKELSQNLALRADIIVALIKQGKTAEEVKVFLNELFS